jgi:preprotein translocase subunit SecF
MRIFKNAQYPFVNWRKRAYIITAVLLVAGFAAMAANYARTGSWLNYGVDFRGGTVVQLQFTQPQRVEDIRSAAGHNEWEINSFGAGGRDFVVRLPGFQESLGRTVESQVVGSLSSRYKPADVKVVRTEAVGPKVGSELQWKALEAILVSLLVTMIYLWFRFEWRFGVAAIAATAHDILVTLGFLALMRHEVSLGTVAAFLTIVGYSLNDTIVVFDRIRENLNKPRHGLDLHQLLDLSINETLPRTVLTATSTLLTLVALFLFGGPVIRPFAGVLILGIVIGTFSSIFVASPVLYFISSKWPHKEKRVQAAPSHTTRQRAQRTTV